MELKRFVLIRTTDENTYTDGIFLTKADARIGLRKIVAGFVPELAENPDFVAGTEEFAEDKYIVRVDSAFVKTGNVGSDWCIEEISVPLAEVEQTAIYREANVAKKLKDAKSYFAYYCTSGGAAKSQSEVEFARKYGISIDEAMDPKSDKSLLPHICGYFNRFNRVYGEREAWSRAVESALIDAKNRHQAACKQYRFGDEHDIRVQKTPIDCSKFGFFDEMEEACWDLAKHYLSLLDIELIPVNGEDGDDAISFDVAKSIQNHILGLIADAGVEFRF